MTGLVAEAFSIYGDNIDLMLEGRLSAIGSDFGVGASDTVLVVPSWETTGKYWLGMLGRGAGIRYGLRASGTSFGMTIWQRLPALPNLNNRMWLADIRAVDNTSLCKVMITTDGNITVHNAAGTQVATTTAPCVIAGTRQKFQFQFVLNNGAGTFHLRVDGVEKIAATGLTMAGTATQAFHGLNDTAFGPHGSMYFDAITVYSLTGTYNDDWPAMTGVGTHYPAADTVVAGFTPYPRQKIEDGILYVPGSGSLLDCDANTDYDLGSGDYTLETFYRPVEPVAGSNFATIMGKWSASTNQRSYRLVQYGPTANEGHLQFQITTDGTLGTLVTVLDINYPLNVGQWYDIAIQRESGMTSIYIDGVRLAPPTADANTYHAAGANAKFCIGGEMSGVATSVLANSSVDGMFDETRITPGVVRYSSNYTPTAVPYPRSAPSDPYFADVVLLAGYDDGIEDESSQAQTLTVRGSAAQLIPDDGSAAYETINPTSPLDDRYLAADLVSATGVLTLTDNPSDTETVTLGASTYTFNTVLGAAGSVLIGADGAESLENLANAINGGPGEGVTYGTGTTINASATAEIGPTTAQLTAAAITPGVAGNSIASTATLADGSWTGTTLSGGADIPGPSEFTITPLSPTVTGVRWIEMIDRSFVNTGSGSLQKSFDVDGTADAGTDNALTVNPTYRADTFEEDPDTAAGLTPASINNGRFVVERTA